MSDTVFSGTLPVRKLRLTQRARRHKVGLAHIAYVIGRVVPVRGTRPSGDLELAWVGLDDRGVELEIIATTDARDKAGDSVLLVIHAMPTALRGS